ncbi:MAG: UvrD-helicase domain-containing protein, partial [Acetoanaerobium sp.]|nr:UvrD-helicase domain-containing protein [Acetoanaerobium sp.]
MDFEQKEAIYHSSGPALVIAGPGCGKTSVITERIYNMVNVLNIDTKSIV